MEVMLTAIVGEVASRSFSFLVDKYSCMAMAEESTTESVDEMLQNLQLLLLRVLVILEEADGRSITSQAMLQQLNILRKEMYRGYYVLDSFRGDHQAKEDEAKKGHNNNVSHYFTLSKFSPAKRLFLSSAAAGGTCTPCVKQVQQVSKNLGTIIFHMTEFLSFLKNYPPRYRQPYFMHLMVGLSMFGRQMEMERVINFLMPTELCTEESTGILPIIGPAGVGKSTLVAHVYSNEKVREHFSRILLVTHEDLKNRRLATLKDGGLTIHHRNNNPSPDGNGRLLVIIELLEDDVEEDTWKRWYLASAACLESGSKIVITSRSSKILKFGTTQALVLTVLPIEAYWYFFKVLTFGSTNPEDQPKLESVALEIARKMNGSFTGANLISNLLRKKFTVQHWLRVLAYTNKYPSNVILREHKPHYYLAPDSSSYLVIYGRYLTNFHHHN